MDELLTEYEEKTGIHVPIHVDAASGGFVAPFAHPQMKWSFEIPRVESINSSGQYVASFYAILLSGLPPDWFSYFFCVTF